MSYGIQPTRGGGRLVAGDEAYGSFAITFHRRADSKPLRIVTEDGTQVGEAEIVFREPLPLDTSPEQEQRKAKAGGCCGQAVEQ